MSSGESEKTYFLEFRQQNGVDNMVVITYTLANATFNFLNLSLMISNGTCRS